MVDLQNIFTDNHTYVMDAHLTKQALQGMLSGVVNSTQTNITTSIPILSHPRAQIRENTLTEKHEAGCLPAWVNYSEEYGNEI